MQIQVSVDHNILGSQEDQIESGKVEEIVKNVLGHFEKHITRVDVHFTDINAGKKGYEDKRCLIEARVSGAQPLVATNNAGSLIEALEGATERLKHSLEHTFGKMKQF